ncbi:MAG: methyltransferase domain-containing protein [Bacteroidota bacterium]|nr:methyltransferase domain-containing protein [Bacteroidota bacterium]
MDSNKKRFEAMYGSVHDERELRWHREEAPPMLEKAVQTGSGAALDIGCGTGVQAVFMARHGYSVTALDFVPKALEFAKKRAGVTGVKINFQEADVTVWNTDQQFDLILDSGCLHSLPQNVLPAYKANILKWLKPNGNYLLLHFGKRSLFSFSLVGPRLRSRKKIRQLFGPELVLKEFDAQDRGGRALFHYRFVRRRSS